MNTKAEAKAAASLRAAIDAAKSHARRARLPAAHTAEIIVGHYAALRKTRPLTQRELAHEAKAKQASGLYK